MDASQTAEMQLRKQQSEAAKAEQQLQLCERQREDLKDRVAPLALNSRKDGGGCCQPDIWQNRP